MPSTITAFYDFVAGTKARSSQVDNNFNNFRGNLIPINENTATASNDTHYLGTSEHQWKRIYLAETPFVGGVQMAAPLVDGMILPFNSDINYAGTDDNDVFADTINRGGIINASSYDSEDLTINDFDSTNKKFGTHSMKTGSNIVLAYPGNKTNENIGSFNAHFRLFGLNDYLAFNPLLGYEMYLNSSGNAVFKITEQTATGESTKQTKSIVGSDDVHTSSSWHQYTCQWVLNGISGTGSDYMSLYIDGTETGTQLTAQTTLLNNSKHGGFWFFGCKPNNPTWSHFYAAADTPDSHTDAWSSTGTSSSVAITNGVLSIDCSGTGFQYYKKDLFIHNDGTLYETLTSTFDFKIKVNYKDLTYTGGAPFFRFYFYKVSGLGYEVKYNFYKNRIKIYHYLQGTAAATYLISADCSKWNTIRHLQYLRVGSEAGGGFGNHYGKFKTYLNGLKILDAPLLSGTLENGYASATAYVEFGENETTNGYNIESEWEYMRYYLSTVGSGEYEPVIANTNVGNIDDIAIFNDIISKSDIERFNSATAANDIKSNEDNLCFPIKSFHTHTCYFQGDGKTEVSIFSSFMAPTTSTFRLTVDESGEGLAYQGFSPDFKFPISTTGFIFNKGIFNAGLHSVKINPNDSLTNASYNFIMFSKE